MKIKDYFEKTNISNKFWYILWGICLVLFLLLFVRFCKYYDAIEDYNLGVKKLKEGDYPTAENLFKSALWDEHTKRQECKIRINYALAIVKPITPESITDENYEESIARLYEAIDVLTENDCAHEIDSNGHSRKAQKLKEEIEEYIKKLEEEKKAEDEKKSSEDKKGEGNSDSQDGRDTDSQDEKDKNESQAENEEERKLQEKEDAIRELMNQASKEGMDERNMDLEIYNNMNGYHSYNYDEKCW